MLSIYVYLYLLLSCISSAKVILKMEKNKKKIRILKLIKDYFAMPPKNTIFAEKYNSK